MREKEKESSKNATKIVEAVKIPTNGLWPFVTAVYTPDHRFHLNSQAKADKEGEKVPRGNKRHPKQNKFEKKSVQRGGEGPLPRPP